MNLDANVYLPLLNPKLRPHVGHAKAAFLNDKLLWVEFDIVAKPGSGEYRKLGVVTYHASNESVNSHVEKLNNGKPYRALGNEADMIAAVERAK